MYTLYSLHVTVFLDVSIRAQFVLEAEDVCRLPLSINYYYIASKLGLFYAEEVANRLCIAAVCSVNIVYLKLLTAASHIVQLRLEFIIHVFALIV